MAAAPILFATVLAGAASFVERAVTAEGRLHRFQVSVPGGRAPAGGWPVILFLHGQGETGEDGVRPTLFGLGPAIHQHPERFPALAVFPQCPRGSAWLGACERIALAALEDVLASFPGDRRRIAVTGVSLGGYGAWQIAARHPGLFAAVAPVAGGVVPPPGYRLPAEVERLAAAGDPYLAALGAPDAHARVARMIGRTPVWIAHGSDDTLVPVSEARAMARALEAAAGRVTYVEIAGAGHSIAGQVYLRPDFARWLTAHRRE
jgi:predicted peptidase